MPVPLFQGVGKVIALRLKRPKQKKRTQESGLEASINPSSDRSFGGVSRAREASDMAQVALPLVQAVAGSIPLVGAPMQAAISGILTGLQAIDRRSQNKSDLDALTSRLNRLCLNLCNAPPARDPAEQLRRDSFIRMLQGTSARVATLHERCLASTPVTQAIAGCFMDIDRYLADYLWSFQIQSQHDIHQELMFLRRQQEELLITIQSLVIHPQSSMRPSASPGATALGCVTLVDATGYHHDIPMSFCTSYQQLNQMLRALFERDAIEAQMQRRYIENGEYDLCIDEGTQVTPLTSHEWSSIEAGTKIVMRVTIKQQTTSLSEVDYQCRFCGAVNRLGVRSVNYQSRGRSVCSTDCRECKRRFQITRALGQAYRLRQSSNSDSNRTTDAETRLIRNFHVQQIGTWRKKFKVEELSWYVFAAANDKERAVCHVVFRASRRTLMILWPWPTLRNKSFYALPVRLRASLPEQVMSRVHVTHITDPAASWRLCKIAIRGMERKKTEKMSLCSSRGWRTDVVIAQSSDVILKLCRIGCSLGDASTEIWDAAHDGGITPS